jgi:hypothetical protein
MSIALILAVVAAVLAIVALIQSRGAELVAWAVLALAAIHIIGAL